MSTEPGVVPVPVVDPVPAVGTVPAVPAVGTVHVVVPDGVDDPARPSGGNAYDRRICSGLAGAGWDVREHAVPGPWPEPDPAAFAALARAVGRVPDDGVVLVDGLIGSAADAVLVREAARVRLVVLVHMPLPAGAGTEEAERAVLSAARAVVTTSAWTRGVLVDRHRLDGDRVHVARPGAEPGDPAAGTPGGGHLLCVGAVAPHKGQDLLVEALAPVAGPWECRLVGPLDRDPAFVARLGRRIAESGVGDRVRLCGPRTGAPLRRQYRWADLLVHPSRLEAYGMVVAEALAVGRPVVAAAVGGVPEALGRTTDGAPGLLVPPGDAGALREALTAWLGNEDLRRRLRRRALDRRSTLPGWDATAACLAAVLTSVVAAPSAGSGPRSREDGSGGAARRHPAAAGVRRMHG